MINSYGPWIFFIPLGPCCDDAYLPIPLTVSNLADFKVFAFISWYDAVGRNILGWPFPPTGPAITVQISAKKNTVRLDISTKLHVQKVVL